MMDKILVTIGVAAFNAEKYIEKCLNSIINQKTNFKFKIIVNDDCSVDNTRNILQEYERKYPDIVSVIYQTKNQYSQGKGIIKTFVLPIVESKYFAICDGDDYWCDEYKLQKQVDFLEANPDYSICFHKMKTIYIDDNKLSDIAPILDEQNPKSYWRLLKANFIPSNSVMYRFEYIKKELPNYPNNIYPFDWFTHILVGKYGKIGFLPEVMSVYRRNSQGISYTETNDPVKEIHLKYGIKEVNFSYNVYLRVKDLYPEYYNEVFLNVLRDVYCTYINDCRFEELSILNKNYSEHFKNLNFKVQDDCNKFKRKFKKYKKKFIICLIYSIIITLLFLIFGIFI